MNNTCEKNHDKIADYVLGLLNQYQTETLENHLSQCPQCKKYADNLQNEKQQLIQLGQNLDKSIQTRQTMVLHALNQLPSQNAKPLPIWRTIMKNQITKLAAAAVIIIVALIGINQLGVNIDGAGVAWAKVIKKVEQIDSFIFQHKMRIKGVLGMHGGKEVDIESTVYVSSENGLRQDKYIDGKEISIAYVPAAGTIVTEVMPSMKKYITAVMTEEQIREINKTTNPKGMIEEFMSFQYKKLGTELIDGIEAEGIEVDDPKFGGFMFKNAKGRLWASKASNLPVRIEIEGTSGDGDIETEIVAYDFDWDVVLESSVFEPNIPDDYILHGEIDISSNEGAAVRGLRLFAELTDGLYPSNLDVMTASFEAGLAIRGKVKNGYEFDPNVGINKQDLEKTTNIQAACRFYAKLIKDGKDAAYYGDEVTADDADDVLMRWKISDNEYRVIYGDLTAENVSADQLTELEAEFTK